MKRFEIYWKDLTPECQERLYKYLGDENGNYDVIPIVTLENEEESAEFNNVRKEGKN